jgi:hypothetical protein
VKGRPLSERLELIEYLFELVPDVSFYDYIYPNFKYLVIFGTEFMSKLMDKLDHMNESLREWTRIDNRVYSSLINDESIILTLESCARNATKNIDINMISWTLEKINDYIRKQQVGEYNKDINVINAKKYGKKYRDYNTLIPTYIMIGNIITNVDKINHDDSTNDSKPTDNMMIIDLISRNVSKSGEFHLNPIPHHERVVYEIDVLNNWVKNAVTHGHFRLYQKLLVMIEEQLDISYDVNSEDTANQQSRLDDIKKQLAMDMNNTLDIAYKANTSRSLRFDMEIMKHYSHL